MAAKARHLGRSVWGGCPQEQAPRAGPKAGRLGKHQPTQPMAGDVGGGMRLLKRVGLRGFS